LARDALNESITARGWKLWYSPPPYTDELPLPRLPRLPQYYSLLILDVAAAHPTEAFEGLDGVISGLRRKFVMPVFVRFAGTTTDSCTPALRNGIATAGAELLLPGESIGRRAHEVLTVRRNLASDWLGWIRLHRPLGRRYAAVIRALVNHDHTGPFTSVDQILREAELAPRSARRWLEQAGLPRARAWPRASRLLRAQLALQQDPDLDVYDAAMLFGYSSGESLSNAMFNFFGHGAERCRDVWGLERRFHEFEHRAGRIRS